MTRFTAILSAFILSACAVEPADFDDPFIEETATVGDIAPTADCGCYLNSALYQCPSGLVAHSCSLTVHPEPCNPVAFGVTSQTTCCPYRFQDPTCGAASIALIAPAAPVVTSEAQCFAMGEDACRMRLIAELGDHAMHLSHAVKWNAWFAPNAGPFGYGRPGPGAAITSRMNNEPARIFEAVNYGGVYVASVLTQIGFARPGYVVVKDEESLAYDFKGDVLPL